MRIWHPDLWEHLPKQWLLGQNKEFAGIMNYNINKKRHKDVQYAIDDDIEKLLALRVKFYRFIKSIEAFNIDTRCGDYRYLNNKLGYIENVDIDRIKYLSRHDKIYNHHDKEYLIECLNNLWKKMTGDTKRWNGEDYSFKHKVMISNMFRDHYKWFIENKSN